MDLSEYYEEVTKTAGLKAEVKVEVEAEDEKVAAVVAVTEQFDIDGIAFEDEDEKIAAAVAIVEGFEKVAMVTKERMEVERANQAVKAKADAAAEKARPMLDKVKDKIKGLGATIAKHPGKAAAIGAGAAAVGGAGAGYLMGKKKSHKRAA